MARCSPSVMQPASDVANMFQCSASSSSVAMYCTEDMRPPAWFSTSR